MDGRARTGLAVLAVAALAAWALGGHGAALTATPAFALEHGDEVDAAYARLRAPRAEAAAVLPAPAPRQTVHFTWLVQDSEGRPLAGVPLTLTPLTSPDGPLDSASWDTALAWQPWLEPDGEALHGVTDESGMLVFDAVPLHRRFLVAATPPAGYGPSAELLRLGVHDLDPPFRSLTLPPAGRPVVIELRGLPEFPEGTCVLVRRQAWTFGPPPMPSEHVLHAAQVVDAQGRVALPDAPETAAEVDVAVPGVGVWQGFALPAELPAGGTLVVDLGVDRPATLCGVLNDREARAVPGARLALAVEPFLRRHPRPLWTVLAMADDDGHFVFPPVPPGRVMELRVLADGFVSPRGLLEGAPLRPGEVVEIAPRIVRAASLSGVVRDEAGAPLAGAEVVVQGDGGVVVHARPTTCTDAQGRWRADGLAPGQATLRVVPPPDRGGLRAASATVDVRPEVHTRAPDMQVSAGPPGGTAGRVVRADGRPAAGALISYRMSQASARGDSASGTSHVHRSDAHGAFRLPGFPADTTEVVVWASQRGAVSPPVTLDLDRAARGDAELHLRLPVVGTLRGRITDPEGRGRPGVEVLLEAAGLRARTDARGVYVLGGVAPGPWTLRLLGPDGDDLGEPASVTVAPEATTVHDVVVQAPPAAAVVEGRLTDAHGRGLAGVELSLGRVRTWPPGVGAITAADGSFRLVATEAGARGIYSGELCLGEHLPGAGEPFDLVFDPARLRLVEAHVTDDTGAPLFAARVTVHASTGATLVTSRAVGGVLRVGVSPAVKGDLEIRAQGSAVDLRGQASVRGFEDMPRRVAGQSIMLRALPVPTGVVEGWVVDAHDVPQEGVVVDVRRRDAPRAGRLQATTDARGLFRIGKVPEGALEIWTRAPARFATNGTWHALPATPGPVRLRLRALEPEQLATIQGVLVDAAGRPVVGAPLHARGHGRHVGCISDAEGGFVLEPLVRGEVYQVDLAFGWAPPGMGDLDTERDWHAEAGGPAVRLALPVVVPRAEDLHPVRCRVVDAQGPWLRGEQVHVRLEAEVHHPAAHEASQTIEGDGPFLFAAVPAGRYRLVAEGLGFDARYLPVHGRVIDVPTDEVVLVLRRARRLMGTVRGRDLEAFRVCLHDEETFRCRGLEPDGSFAFWVDPDVAYDVSARAVGDVRYGHVAGVTADASPIALPLEDGLSIEGRIEDLPDDLARFEIRVDGDAVHASGELLHDGRFRVTGLPPGTYQVWVLDGSGRYAPRDVEAGSTGVVITPRR